MVANNAFLLKDMREKSKAEGRIEGREEGIKEGIREGIEAKAVAIALEMLRDKESIDKIMKYTKLSKEQILGVNNKE
ncbi:hypothetical protein KQI77_02810 [Clostridium sp. MSJ-8]|uniref:hypothetical protein n=1 Tax=Clostridium sp. MSJ-8 TaxID=2841510 RepID=UPI001C0EA159|nr:hypothetical protein [Clostridium sp. MSJ-8]MBU5487093.1 hypothetical protein [Clostridium sp. MSJ-8]